MHNSGRGQLEATRECMARAYAGSEILWQRQYHHRAPISRLGQHAALRIQIWLMLEFRLPLPGLLAEPRLGPGSETHKISPGRCF